MDRNLKSYAFSNWERQTALVCEYICFWLASVIWGVCVLSCSVVSDSVTPLTFGDVTSNQIIGTRFIGTAFAFMPLFLSNRTVQAKCHGQHRDSKTLKSASRPWGPQSVPEVLSEGHSINISPACRPGKPLTIKGSLVSWAGELGVPWVFPMEPTPAKHHLKDACLL